MHVLNEENFSIQCASDKLVEYLLFGLLTCPAKNPFKLYLNYIITSSQLVELSFSSVGRALHRYRRGHGFKSRTGLNFFQALFPLLPKQCKLLRGSLSFTSLSAVQIYDFHIFLTVYSSLHGFIQNQHHDQLPVGLLAQLVERCTGIAQVMGSNPVQA